MLYQVHLATNHIMLYQVHLATNENKTKNSSVRNWCTRYPTISLCHLWHPILVNTRDILLTNDVSYRYSKSSLYHHLLNSVKLGSGFTSLEVERYDWRWVGQLESYMSLEVERYDWRWVGQLESYTSLEVERYDWRWVGSLKATL